jgi:hypothetical protein
MTSSRKRTPRFTTSPRRSHATVGPESPIVTNFERLTEPRLHASYGSSGCSPQGFVDSISPRCGVGLSRLMRSMKMMPGSPVAHAIWTICS